MPKHGKKYLEARAKVKKASYTLKEAIALLKETATAKFDSSCELHLTTGIDPKQADQAVRSTISLPHGTGKELRVVAFVSDDEVKACQDAGAVEAGSEALIEKVAKGYTDFDVAVATPALMPKLGKIAKTLGQKGLMPSPKSGTVTPDPAKAVKELKSGKVEFRNDKQGGIKNIFGKVSFKDNELEENLSTLLKAIMSAKPSAVKGTYIKTVYLTTTMGPSIPVAVQELNSL